MTPDELRTLAAIERQVSEVAKAVNEDVRPQLATIAATLKAEAARRADEIKILFRKVEDAVDRLRQVELDYTPKADHAEAVAEERLAREKLERENGDEHDELSQRLTRVEAKVLKLGLAAGIIVTVVQAVGYLLAKKVIG